MHATFTSGIARRRDIDAARLQNPEHELTVQDIEGINAEHEREGRVNPILDLFRDHTYNGDPDMHDTAAEFLFQLARHWSAWQSPRIGTFPLEYRDVDGPADRETSEEHGDDHPYWEIDDVLAGSAGIFSIEENRWDTVGHRRSDGDRIQDYIVHATAVLRRIHEATGDDA